MIRKLFILSLFISASAFHVRCGGGGGDGRGSSSTPPDTVSDWPDITLTEVLSGFSQPLGIYHAGDGSGRLFIVERSGKIWSVRSGNVIEAPFLDISERITTSGSEQGLLGLAFPSDFENRKHFYINYTRSSDGSTVVARYQVSDSDPDTADPESEEIILSVEQPFSNHNGGQIAFGPDGYLYIGMGDGGFGGDPFDNAQSTNTLLGKILRIDVESSVYPYSISSDNPFAGDSDANGEIWALGLRNPWRFSFDRKTGDLFIADVGQSSYEEVNFQPSSSGGGENYGWNTMEGTHCFFTSSCVQTGLTLPIAEYDHSEGNCSVTGGFVYRGTDYPLFEGIYFYGDFCSGIIWGLRNSGSGWEGIQLSDTDYLITTFGEDESGEIYLADYNSGNIYLITGR